MRLPSPCGAGRNRELLGLGVAVHLTGTSLRCGRIWEPDSPLAEGTAHRAVGSSADLDGPLWAGTLTSWSSSAAEAGALERPPPESQEGDCGPGTWRGSGGIAPGASGQTPPAALANRGGPERNVGRPLHLNKRAGGRVARPVDETWGCGSKDYGSVVGQALDPMRSRYRQYTGSNPVLPPGWRRAGGKTPEYQPATGGLGSESPPHAESRPG